MANHPTAARPALKLDLLISAYCCGAFPMSEDRDAPVSWYEADPRAILPIAEGDPAGAFHVPRSLKKFLRKEPFELSVDHSFYEVVMGCAEPGPGREQTWISQPIIDVFVDAHDVGLAHSVEAWRNDRLVGGLYGLALGGAFFAESMFSRESGASKACLVELVRHLRERGFRLLDVQFSNPHLEQFGVVTISRDAYHERLSEAIDSDVVWADLPKSRVGLSPAEQR